MQWLNTVVYVNLLGGGVGCVSCRHINTFSDNKETPYFTFLNPIRGQIELVAGSADGCAHEMSFYRRLFFHYKQRTKYFVHFFNAP